MADPGGAVSTVESYASLLRRHFAGVLGTHCVYREGYPFASRVPYCPDAHGHPLLAVSALAQHTQNLLADARVALNVWDDHPEDVQAASRATLLGDMELADTDAGSFYIEHFPAAAAYLQELDFTLYRLRVRDVHFIAGFANVHWLDAGDLADVPAWNSAQQTQAQAGVFRDQPEETSENRRGHAPCGGNRSARAYPALCTSAAARAVSGDVAKPPGRRCGARATDSVSLWPVIVAHLQRQLKVPCRYSAHQPLAGGDINRAFLLECGDQRFFVKLNAAENAGMFAAEAAGLEALSAIDSLRVPRPICHGTHRDQAYLAMDYLQLRRSGNQRDAGQALAELHQLIGPRYGWLRDNTIGTTTQCNDWCDNWADFWSELRLGPQLDLAERHGYARELRGGRELQDCVSDLLQGHKPVASLLHGDPVARQFRLRRARPAGDIRPGRLLRRS